MILIDVAVGIVLLVALFFFMVSTTFTEGGLHSFLGIGIPTIITGLVLTVFYPVRYQVAGVLLSLIALHFLYRYLRYSRPLNQYRKRAYMYFGEILTSHIPDATIVNSIAHGSRPIESPIDHQTIYLFISPEDYTKHFSGHDQLMARWQFINIPAMPADAGREILLKRGYTLGNRFHFPHLFLLLHIETVSVALPLFGGALSESGDIRYHPTYLNVLGLEGSESGRTVTIYPLDKKHLKKTAQLLDVTDYFAEHIEHQNHIQLDVPYFNYSQTEQYWGDRKSRSSRKKLKSEFRIFKSTKMDDAIEVAIKLQRNYEK